MARPALPPSFDGCVAARVGVGGALQPGFLNNPRFLASKDTRRAVIMVSNDPVETTPKLWDDPTLSQTLKLEWEPGATDVEVKAHPAVHHRPLARPSHLNFCTRPVTRIRMRRLHSTRARRPVWREISYMCTVTVRGVCTYVMECRLESACRSVCSLNLMGPKAKAPTKAEP